MFSQLIYTLIQEPTSNDAILNGVEVFKLSNPDGNLIGPSQMLPFLPVASTSKDSKTMKTVFIAIGSGVGVLVVLTLVCCMVLLKLRKSRHYVSRKMISYHMAGIFHTGAYTGTEIVVFHTGLNINRIGIYTGFWLEIRYQTREKEVDLKHSNPEILLLTPIWDLFLLASHW